MFKIIIICLSLVLAKVPGEKVNRAESKKNILKGCIEMSSAVANQKKKICECVVANFDKKANDYEMQLLAENYKARTEDTTVQQDIPASALQAFDYEVATECIKNPQWRIKIKK